MAPLPPPPATTAMLIGKCTFRLKWGVSQAGTMNGPRDIEIGWFWLNFSENGWFFELPTLLGGVYGLNLLNLRQIRHSDWEKFLRKKWSRISNLWPNYKGTYVKMFCNKKYLITPDLFGAGCVRWTKNVILTFCVTNWAWKSPSGCGSRG